jgi:hypothetical protein
MSNRLKEESIKYLSKAVDLGQGSTIINLFVEYNPIFKNFRDDPDFKTIIKQDKENLEKVQAQINEMRERGELNL